MSEARVINHSVTARREGHGTRIPFVQDKVPVRIIIEVTFPDGNKKFVVDLEPFCMGPY